MPARIGKSFSWPVVPHHRDAKNTEEDAEKRGDV
jgi:hypothetical protein